MVPRLRRSRAVVTAVRRGWILLAIAVAAPIAGGVDTDAQARSVPTADEPHAPKLAGRSVLWIQRPNRKTAELWTLSPGQQPRRVRVFEEPSGRGLAVELATSPTRTLFTTFNYVQLATEYSDAIANPAWYLGVPGSSLEPFDQCNDQLPSMRSSDVWGDAYVYRRCGEPRERVAVRDESNEPMSPPRDVGVSGIGARIAGRFVAWLETEPDYNAFCCSPVPDIVVYDRVNDVEVYRLPAAELPGLIRGLDLQDDGKVAFSYVIHRSNDVAGEGLGWASPSEPYFHRLPVPDGNLNDFRLIDDQVAYQGGLETYFFWVKSAKIGLIDLQGNGGLLARRTDARMFSESFDFDGERVVWRELGCEKYRLVIVEASRQSVAPGPRRRCPLQVLESPTVRNGKVTLRLSCGPNPDWWCPWHIALYTTGAVSRRIGRGRHDGSPVHLRLSNAGRRLLARKGSLHVRVRARIERYWAPEVRRTTVQLTTRG